MGTTAIAPLDEVTSARATILWTRDLTRADIPRAGGKGANLGELQHAGFPVPPAFVVSIEGYRRFRDTAGIGVAIDAHLASLDINDTAKLQSTAAELRAIVEDAPIPADVETEIIAAYDALSRERGVPSVIVAVRSSATAEDTQQYSFAGMFESFLNVRGRNDLLRRVRSCWASTFHARVLYYRLKQGLPGEMPVAVIVQAMVAGDKAGVAFSVDPSTSDANRIVIEAAWGLGESVVLGKVSPDRYVIAKDTLAVVEAVPGTKDLMIVPASTPAGVVEIDLTHDPRRTARVLSEGDVRIVAELVRRVETHYGTPQDIEFVIEGPTVFLTQARPITTLAHPERAPAAVKASEAASARVLVRGLGASPGRASGAVRVLSTSSQASVLRAGEVLVTRITSPDWVPVMRRAAAIVTDAGGMTSHAAIVSRELGLPCVVGTTNATATLTDGQVVTVDGASGTVVEGALPAPNTAPAAVAGPEGAGFMRTSAPVVTATRIYVNLGEPDRAEAVSRLDVDGVGLLRAEFMLLSALDRAHPRKLLAEGHGETIVEKLAEGLRTFGRAFAPRPVIYRAMDFRTNEFRGLEGGDSYEAVEENPMIGYRGCFRYIKEPDLFALELRALAAARTEFPNVHLMIPFVRTGWEFRECKRLIDASPLARDRTLQLWVMAEVPSVMYWLPEYVRGGVTGVSIGSNDLTQLMLGVDRDSKAVAPLFDERDGAVLDAIRTIIEKCHALGVTCSICGQAPSVYPEFADHLVRWGIDSISVNPDVIDRTRVNVAAAEQRLLVEHARRATSAGSEERGHDDV